MSPVWTAALVVSDREGGVFETVVLGDCCGIDAAACDEHVCNAGSRAGE